MPDVRIHTCKAGENWCSIAFDLKLAERQFHSLIDANPGYADVLVFEGGEQLIIPDVESLLNKSDLPPWRQ